MAALDWATTQTALDAALTGGTGGSFAAVTARIDRALLLPAAADHVTTLRGYRAALATSYADKPTRETSGTDLYRRKGRVRLTTGFNAVYDRSVLELEDDLTALLAEAASLLATVAY